MPLGDRNSSPPREGSPRIRRPGPPRGGCIPAPSPAAARSRGRHLACIRSEPGVGRQRNEAQSLAARPGSCGRPAVRPPGCGAPSCPPSRREAPGAPPRVPTPARGSVEHPAAVACAVTPRAEAGCRVPGLAPSRGLSFLVGPEEPGPAAGPPGGCTSAGSGQANGRCCWGGAGRAQHRVVAGPPPAPGCRAAGRAPPGGPRWPLGAGSLRRTGRPQSLHGLGRAAERFMCASHGPTFARSPPAQLLGFPNARTTVRV